MLSSGIDENYVQYRKINLNSVFILVLCLVISIFSSSGNGAEILSKILRQELQFRNLYHVAVLSVGKSLVEVCPTWEFPFGAYALVVLQHVYSL